MTTTNQHLITPPPELLQQWMNEICDDPDGDPHFVSSDDRALATRAAQWGADQELDACVKWVEANAPGYFKTHEQLRAARRPKPPSLKEQALKMLRPLSNPVMPGTPEYRLYEPQAEIIRRALEALPDD